MTGPERWSGMDGYGILRMERLVSFASSRGHSDCKTPRTLMQVGLGLHVQHRLRYPAASCVTQSRSPARYRPSSKFHGYPGFGPLAAPISKPGNMTRSGHRGTSSGLPDASRRPNDDMNTALVPSAGTQNPAGDLRHRRVVAWIQEPWDGTGGACSGRRMLPC